MSRGKLTRERIVELACEMVREKHLDELSMRALAERLGTTPMALYKHVADRKQLQRLVVERSFSTLELPPAELAVIAWLEQLARDVRTVGLDHPGVMDFVLEHGPLVEGTLRVLDRTVLKLREAGLSFREALELHNTLFSWLAGSVLRQQRTLARQREPFAEFLETARALPKREFPGIARTLSYLEKLDFESEFELSLRLLLDAIATRIERAQR